MLPNDDMDGLRLKLTHAEAVIAELRGVVAELRKQIESQQAHIHRLVKITFGRGGERVEGPTLFDGIVVQEAEAVPVAHAIAYTRDGRWLVLGGGEAVPIPGQA